MYIAKTADKRGLRVATRSASEEFMRLQARSPGDWNYAKALSPLFAVLALCILW